MWEGITMNMCRYFLCFALFGFIGWAYESAYYTLQQRRFVNSGFLNGCCCPIYGIGALLDLMLLGNIESPVKLFLAGMVVTCTLEYAVSWILEALFHRRWWDYTNWPLNINGRVCIIGGAVFGIMSVLLIKVIAPVTIEFMLGLSDTAVNAATAVIALAMIADVFITVRNSDSFSEKLWYVREQAGIFEETGIGGRIAATISSHRPHPIETIKRFLKK